MSQNDYVIGNQTAPNFRSDLNDALQALASLSSGSTAPSTTYANMLWYDTGNNILKMRTEADDDWIDIGTLNQSTNTFEVAGLTTLAQSVWETGTDTTEALVSPAKVKAAVDSLVDVTDIPTTSLRSPTAGTGHLIRRVQEETQDTTSTSYFSPDFHDRLATSAHLGVTCLVPGVITCYALHTSSVGFQSAFLRVLKNGVEVAEWTTINSSFVARSVNVSVAVGDVIIFQQRTGSASSSTWAQLRIYSNNPDMAVA